MSRLNPRTDIAAGLFGAALLARGRRDGLRWMADTPAGAWLAVAAAAIICVPAFLALRLLTWSELGVPPGGLWRSALAELAGYVVAWFGFALLSLPLLARINRVALWPRYLAAWAWTNVAQYVVLLGVLALPEAFGISGIAAQVLGLAGFGYAVWLEWFAAREAAQLSGVQAAMLVGFDLLLGLFVGSISAALAA